MDRVSKDEGVHAVRVVILRDASLRSAPQDEVGVSGGHASLCSPYGRRLSMPLFRKN
jgi:hypothetical protein